MERTTLLALFVAISYTLLKGVNGSPQLTQALYQEAHYHPILIYECFRSGITTGPPDNVNHAFLYDLTQPNSYYGAGSSWFSRASNPGRVYKTPMITQYDQQNGVGITHFPGLTVYADVAARSPNGMGLFFRLSIPSQNREVLKVYDQSPSCQNARALLSSVCPQCQMAYSRTDSFSGMNNF